MTSPLKHLKARRASLLAEQYLDLAVPRWHDPEIVVRYRPVPHHEIRGVQMRMEKIPAARRAEFEVNSNADILVRSCIGVYAKLDGKEYSLRPDDHEGEWTRFDEDLAANLGLEPDATARDVCKALFLTEPDILSHASKLGQWSGYKEADADEAFQGE